MANSIKKNYLDVTLLSKAGHTVFPVTDPRMYKCFPDIKIDKVNNKKMRYSFYLQKKVNFRWSICRNMQLALRYGLVAKTLGMLCENMLNVL